GVYALSLHDALPICRSRARSTDWTLLVSRTFAYRFTCRRFLPHCETTRVGSVRRVGSEGVVMTLIGEVPAGLAAAAARLGNAATDRKSTRLNYSHGS